jgi:tight adherence protein B
MIDARYLVYAMIAIAVMMGAQATFQYFSNFRSYRRSVNKRLGIIDKSGTRSDSLAELRLRRSLSAEGRYILPFIWFNRLVMQSGVSMNAKKLLMLMSVLAVATYAGVYAFSGGALLASALALVVGFGVPLQFLRIARSRRITRFESQLPDGLDVMVRSLRVGHPIPVSMSMVARELPDPLGSEFGMVFDELTYGLDTETAMANMQARVGQADLALVVVAVSIQSKTGGNLAEILSSLSNVLRDRFGMRRKVRALSAEGRFSAIALSILPFIVAGALFTIAPVYYTAVWDDPVFMPIVSFAVLLLLIGDYIMYRMVNFRF